MTAALAFAAVCGAQAEEQVVLQENFDKLETAMEAGVHKYGKNPWTGKDVEGVEYQPNYNTIQTDGNVADLNGWSSRTTYMYACQGFIRISKTSFGGDLRFQMHLHRAKLLGKVLATLLSWLLTMMALTSQAVCMTINTTMWLCSAQAKLKAQAR